MPRVRRRRIAAVLILAATLAMALVAVPDALAAAGGGSSGFGGGAGGRGRGAGLYLLIQLLVRVMLLGHGLGALVVVGLILAYLFFTRVTPSATRFYKGQRQTGRAERRRVGERQRRVELAAAEAAEDDPAYAPDAVRQAAANLFTEVQLAWSDGDRERLRVLVAPALLAEWERRLEDFHRHGWQNKVMPLQPPQVEYVSLSRRGEVHDHVVVRIEARMRDYVVDAFGNHIKRAGRPTETVRVREYWTLARRAPDTAHPADTAAAENRPNARPERWVLQSIEQGAEGAHALEEQVVATPWSDDQGLRDEALVEAAVADAVPDGTSVAEVADLDFRGEARAAALDLSLADGRFAPDILEVAARRAVAAWGGAIDGGADSLRSVATAAAAEQLLYGGDPSHRKRIVIRGPQVKQIRIIALDAAADPPSMTIEVEVAGRRYVEDRDTGAVTSGSQWQRATFTERWVLTLDGDERQPWRIASAWNPLARH